MDDDDDEGIGNLETANQVELVEGGNLSLRSELAEVMGFHIMCAV